MFLFLEESELFSRTEIDVRKSDMYVTMDSLLAMLKNAIAKRFFLIKICSKYKLFSYPKMIIFYIILYHLVRFISRHR